MKKLIILFTITFVVCLWSCSQSEKTPYVIRTYEATSPEYFAECVENSREITLLTYHEMSDGTWKVNDEFYEYKLEILGTLNNGTQECTYIILSNTENVKFDSVSKLSGLSSLIYDCYRIENAIIVGFY